MALTKALERITLSKQQLEFWEVQLKHAIETFNHACSAEHRQSSSGSRKVYYELDQFHRSLNRKPQPATIIRNWKCLHEAGQMAYVEITLQGARDLFRSELKNKLKK